MHKDPVMQSGIALSSALAGLTSVMWPWRTRRFRKTRYSVAVSNDAY